MTQYNNDLFLTDIVKGCIDKGHEGDFWDFKQEWHKESADLMKDIICFANTVHSENCYLIFGVNDNCEIVGMGQYRYKLADILDTLSRLDFATPTIPEIKLDTIVLEKKEIDVLTVCNTDQTPIYLKTKYGKMNPGCIYLRKGDRNTPDNSNSLLRDIEMLWKKRFGLTKPQLEYINDHLNCRIEWNEFQNSYYNIYHPEYVIERVCNEEDSNANAEFYAYAMTNKNITYSRISIKCFGTIMDIYQIVSLDGGRYFTPVPEWGIIDGEYNDIEDRILYKYFLKDTFRYNLHRFLYNDKNGEEREAYNKLIAIVLIFDTEEEKNNFEKYIRLHIDILSEGVKKRKDYSYIQAETDLETNHVIRQLRTALVLQEMLKEFRKQINVDSEDAI